MPKGRHNEVLKNNFYHASAPVHVSIITNNNQKTGVNVVGLIDFKPQM